MMLTVWIDSAMELTRGLTFYCPLPDESSALEVDEEEHLMKLEEPELGAASSAHAIDASLNLLEVDPSFLFLESLSDLHRIDPSVRSHSTVRTLKNIATCFLSEDQLPAIFVAHYFSGCIMPYHLTAADARDAALLSTLRLMSSDRALPSNANPAIIRRLRRIGALLSSSQLEKQAKLTAAAIKEASSSWSQHCLVSLPRVLSSHHVRALQFYISAKMNWDRCHHVWTWNEPIASAINCMMSPLATQLIGQQSQLLSSGPVTHLYAPKSVLGVHIDTGVYYHSMSIYLEAGTITPDGHLSTVASGGCPPLCVIRRSGPELISEHRLKPVFF